jgi:sporulation protein YlmC with PRC-barrel domain
MDISINAKVRCKDGECGRITCVIFNPVTEDLTHIVVKEDSFPNEERSVSLKFVQSTISDTVLLNCTKAEFSHMDQFIRHEYIELEKSFGGYPSEWYVYLPYSSPIDYDFMEVQHEHIPAGELAIHRGAKVRALDGQVGKVDEFLIEPANGHITHLVMREGHIWDQKDVSIPISEIDHVEDDIVYLKTDKNEIAALPAVPIHHWF